MRATRRHAKPGEVLVCYGRLPGDMPDHLIMYGGHGATKRHSNVVYGLFATPETMKALDAAGFDTKTIEVRIRVKKEQS